MSENHKLNLFKTGLSVVIGIGVTKIVSGVVESHVSKERPIRDRLPVATAEVAVGLVVSQIIQERVDKTIDETVEWYRENKSNLKRLFGNE